MEETEMFELDEKIEEYFNNNYPNSTCSDFIIGKKEDKITVDDVFNIIKNSFMEYYMKRDALRVNCSKYGIYYDEKTGTFNFLNGDFLSEKNQKINEEIEKKFGINVFDCFSGYFDFSKFETYKDYEEYWISKIRLAKTDEDVFAPLVIVDSSIQEEYFGIQMGVESAFGSNLKNETLKLKKNILLRKVFCYKYLSTLDFYKTNNHYHSCDKCKKDKSLCRLYTEYYDKAKEEDINKFVSSYGKIIVSTFFREIPYRVLYDLGKIAIFCD